MGELPGEGKIDFNVYIIISLSEMNNNGSTIAQVVSTLVIFF